MVLHALHLSLLWFACLQQPDAHWPCTSQKRCHRLSLLQAPRPLLCISAPPPSAAPLSYGRGRAGRQASKPWGRGSGNPRTSPACFLSTCSTDSPAAQHPQTQPLPAAPAFPAPPTGRPAAPEQRLQQRGWAFSPLPQMAPEPGERLPAQAAALHLGPLRQ